MKKYQYLTKIAVLETQVAGFKENVKLQAIEYERRLTELNHAHAQAAEDKNKFVNIDLFYAKIDEIGKWRAENDVRWSKLNGFAIGIGAAGGIIGGIVTGIILKLLK